MDRKTHLKKIVQNLQGKIGVPEVTYDHQDTRIQKSLFGGQNTQSNPSFPATKLLSGKDLVVGKYRYSAVAKNMIDLKNSQKNC